MPTYAVEFKSSNGDMKEAKLQCAYDGALMTERARTIHKHTGKPNKYFYGRTQALTVSFNGETIKFFGHHVIQNPTSLQPTASDATDTLQYHQYLCAGDTPRDSLENFQSAYKHTRNAEDLAYKLVTARKDTLWAHAKADKSHTSQEPLLAEDGQDQRVTQSPPSNDGRTSSNAMTSVPITPPRSSKNVSLPVKSQQLSMSAVRVQREVVDLNGHGRRRTRQARIRAVDAVKSSTELDQNSKQRKTRKQRYS